MVTFCWDITGPDSPTFQTSKVSLFQFQCSFGIYGGTEPYLQIIVISSTKHLLECMSTMTHFLLTVFPKAMDRYFFEDVLMGVNE